MLKNYFQHLKSAIIYELSIQKLFNQYFKPVSRSNLHELYQKVFLYLEIIYLNSILTV